MKNKTLCSKILLFAFVLFWSFHTHGQETILNPLDSMRLKNGVAPVKEPDIRVPVIKALSKHMMTDNDAFWKKPVEIPYLIAIAISFDASGKAKDVFFSKSLTSAQRQKLRIDSLLITKLKSLDLQEFNYRDEVVMFPILYLDYHAREMTLETGFIKDFTNLWPQFDMATLQKKLTLLDPYYNFYGAEVRTKNQKATSKNSSSSYRIVSDAGTSSLTSVSVHFKDQDGYEMYGYLGLRDKDGKSIAGYLSDKNGFVSLIIYDTENIGQIVLDNIGYDRITIPFSRLKHKNSTIHVRLKGQSTSN